MNSGPALTLGPGLAEQYVGRVLGVLQLRPAGVDLDAAALDTYLALVGVWALAGCPTHAFALRLEHLVELVDASSANTVRGAVRRLVAVGLIDEPSDAAKGRPTQYRLAETPVDLLNRVQKLNPKVAARLDNTAQILNRIIADASLVRVQNLNPIIADRVQDLNPNGAGPAVAVQPLNPIIDGDSTERRKPQHISTETAAANSPVAADFGHSMVKDKENEVKPTEKKEPKRRPKKGDGDFPAEVVASFEIFWKVYGRKGDRYLTLGRWAELSLDDRAAVMRAAVPYVAANSGPRWEYRAYAENFLSKRRFDAVNARLDEIEKTQTQPSQNPLANVNPSTPRRNSEHLKAPEHRDEYPEL